MILFYTGAASPGSSQTHPDKSLGGFVSGSSIPNGKLANLFSTVTRSNVLNEQKQIRMIALKNITGDVVNNVKIFTGVANSHIKLRIAAVTPYVNSQNQEQFESVMDDQCEPYQAELNYNEGEENCITIDSLAAGETIGIWIQREINAESFPELNVDLQAIKPQEYADLLKSIEESIQETVQLSISYD